MPAIYKRILLKISGESLSGAKGSGIDNDTLHKLGQTIRDLIGLGVQVAIVVGGGNFWRGRTSEGMDRVTADHMGMLATAMNALALSDALEQAGVGDPSAQCDRNAPVLRALYPQKGSPPSRKRPRRHLCLRHRQSVLFDRYRSCPACIRNRGRHHLQGDDGRWRL